MKDRKIMGTAMEIDQSNAKLLADLKRMKESLFYSEDKVSSLTERVQMRDKDIETHKAKNSELQQELDKQVDSLATLKLEYDLLKQHDKKQKVKRDRLTDMLQHSEQVIDSRRDELEGLRSSLADAESQLDSLNTETYHLNLGRMQLENANEALRMQLATTLEQLEDLQQRGSSGDDDDLVEGHEEDNDGSGEDSVCDEDERSRRRPLRTASSHDSWSAAGSSTYDDDTPSNKTPRGSPSHKLIRQLQHKVEMMTASKHDNDVIIENLNKHIDSVNLASSNKINDLATQNTSLKEKGIQLMASLDALKVDHEESEKKVLSLVAERYNLQSDIESQKAQIVYLKSRQRTMEARSAKSPEGGVATPRDGPQLKASNDSTIIMDSVTDTGSGTGPDSEATTIEMVNTLIVQNKELLASNMEWEQRYESIDLLSKAAVKGRKLLTEESIELKGDMQRLGDEKQQLQETNRALVEEVATAKQQAKNLQKELLSWRQKYESAVASGGSSGVSYGGDTDTAFDLTRTSDVDRSSITSKDNEREDLINALIEAKMSAASAALERDTRRASCNSETESGFVKRTFINSQYNNKVEEDLVQQLITAKMNAAGFALERDEHGKRIVGLKRLIQFYAERVATLEVAAARGIQAPKTASAPAGVEKAQTSSASLLLCGSMFRKSNTSIFNPVWKWEKKYFELRADRISIHEDENGESLGEFKFSAATKLVMEPENSATRHANAWTTFRSFTLEGGCSSNSRKRLDIGADSVVEAELWVDAIKQALQRLSS